MEIINGNKIVKYIYETGCDQITAKTRVEAIVEFEKWINKNTPYRGLSMFAKHKGYVLIFEDEYGNRYIRNGMKTYQIDQHGNVLKDIE